MRILAIDPGDKWGAAWLLPGGGIEMCSGRLTGRSPADKKRRLRDEARRLLAYPLDAGRWDLLVIERPVPPGPGRSVLGTISLSMTAGVWIGAVDCEELRIVTPSEWNSKGRGLAAATRYAKKYGLIFRTEDEKSALGMLLWALKEVGEEGDG